MIRTAAPFASFAERAFAQLVDIAVLLVCTTLLGTIFSQISSVGIYLILSMNYFMYFHQKWGQTPGKMIMNIRVVTLDEHKFLPMHATFLRELVRTFLPLTLCLGYLTSLFDVNKQALHDKFSKTCVIKNSSEKTSFFKFSAAFLTSLLLIVTTGIYVLIATPWPLIKINQKLAQAGIDASSFSGSLLSGISIKYLHFSSPLGESRFKNLSFKVDILKILTGKFITIEQLDIESGKFIASNQSILKTLDQQFLKAAANIDSTNFKDSGFLKLKNILIKTINVKEMTYEYQNYIAYSDRTTIDHLELNTFAIPTEVKRIFISTDLFLLDIGNVKNSSNTIQFERPVHYTLHSSFFENLKIDISGQIEPQFKGKNLQSLKFSSFDNHMHGILNGKSKIFSLRQFAPKDYFWSPLPFSQMDISTTIRPHETFADSAWNGSIVLGKKQLPVVNNKFTVTHSRSAKGTLLPQGFAKAVLGETTPIVLWNNPFDDSFWAKAYFNTSVENISENNQVYFQSIKNYFEYKNNALQNNLEISVDELRHLREQTKRFLRKGKRTPATK